MHNEVSFPLHAACGAAYLTAPNIAARHAFSTRLGGVSTGVLESLNLSVRRGDTPENVRENWRRLGAHPADIRAAIGPGIGACCFEVGPEVVAAAEALLHEPLGAFARPRADGKALLDLKGVNARRLAQLGVPAGQIAVSDACTMCRPDVFWSHRATNGRRGVQAAVITL